MIDLRREYLFNQKHTYKFTLWLSTLKRLQSQQYDRVEMKQIKNCQIIHTYQWTITANGIDSKETIDLKACVLANKIEEERMADRGARQRPFNRKTYCTTNWDELSKQIYVRNEIIKRQPTPITFGEPKKNNETTTVYWFNWIGIDQRT